MYRYLFLLFTLFICQIGYSTTPVRIFEVGAVYKVSPYTSYLEDAASQYSIKDVMSKTFVPTKIEVPNFFITKSTYWVRFTIENETKIPGFILSVQHATLDQVTLYTIDSTNKIDSSTISEDQPFYKRFYKNQAYMFNIFLQQGEQKTFYIKVKASEQLLLPIVVGHKIEFLENLTIKDLIFGLYSGLIIVMFFYNLFLFFTTNDRGYLYYVLYILFVGLSQAMLQGYTFRFLWPQHPHFNNYAAVIIPFMNGVAAIEFVRHFLNLRTKYKSLNRGLNWIAVIYLIGLTLCIFDLQFSQIIIQFAAFAGSFYALWVCILLSRKGSRPATILLIGWSFFLLSVIIFVLRNFGLLPYNNFTFYALQFGSSMQAVILSMALADKINTYRKAESIARREALQVSLENENLIKEQNIMLEREVLHRTEELTKTNEELQMAMDKLKDTQTQLVNAEKMSSLGQLTAGIAHEINNPINFVTSNIRPLQLDFDDIAAVLKKYETVDLSRDLAEQLEEIETFKKQIDLNYVQEEVKSLLAGINEGALRTAEIVRGLKNFARVDEDNMKFVNLNDGIRSTLLLIRNTFSKNMQLVLDLADLPNVECVPGKMNQVFMNVISNAVHAIKAKHQNDLTGVLSIKSWVDADSGHVKISITDNGTGMPEDVKNRIFDPFFTTKDVGEGTGLGMSIVQGIIERHKGSIIINTKEGTGTEFILTLPQNQAH